MIDSSATSVALNLLALLGAAVFALAQARAREASPVDVRLAWLFALLTLLMGVRSARWGLEIEGLRRLEEALAAGVPLLALLLAEGLMRRHAPPMLKRVAAYGGAALALGALARPESAAPSFAYVLGGFVALSLAWVALFLATRARDSLAPGENAAISALFVGLVLALPLATTDFLAAVGASPIRAGGLGLLVFIFAVARVTAYGGGGLGVLAELCWTAAAAALGLATFVLVLSWPGALAALNWYAIILALVLLFRIVQYLREQRAARSRSSLWRAFAEAPMTDLDAFLDRMLDAPEMQNARVLEGAALADYDHDALRRAFAGAPVIAVAQARGAGGGAYEQLAVLFDAQEATHAVCVSERPLRLLLVNLPRVGAGADAELQMRLMAKLAAHVGARDA